MLVLLYCLPYWTYKGINEIGYISLLQKQPGWKMPKQVEVLSTANKW